MAPFSVGGKENALSKRKLFEVFHILNLSIDQSRTLLRPLKPDLQPPCENIMGPSITLDAS